MNQKWINIYLTFFYRAGKTIPYQGGSNNLRNLKFQQYITINIPLAPLPEQRAIVAKIEQLFSELDNGIANLKTAKEKLVIYRQAVLKKAFEGELTKEWQEKKTDFPLKQLFEIADVATGSTPKKGNTKYWKDGTISWVTSGALNDLFVTSASALITTQALKETNCKIFPKTTLYPSLVLLYSLIISSG